MISPSSCPRVIHSLCDSVFDLASSISPDQIGYQGLETDCDNELLFLEIEKRTN